MVEFPGTKTKATTSHTNKLPTCWGLAGFSALLVVGLGGVHKLEELQELEFGRGFAYHQPLSVTLQPLPSVLLKQLVSILLNTVHRVSKALRPRILSPSCVRDIG